MRSLWHSLAATLALLAVSCAGSVEPAPTSVEVLGEIDAALGRGDRELAWRLSVELVEAEPRWDGAWRAYAMVARGRQDWSRAIEAGRRLVGDLGGGPEDAARLADAGLRLGDAAAAAEGLAALRRLDPDGPLTHETGARVAFEEGDLAGAGRLARAALAAGPALPDAHHLAALAAQDGGDRAAAIGHCRRALEADFGHLGARDLLATLLALAGEMLESEEHRRTHSMMIGATRGGFRKGPAQERLVVFADLSSRLPRWELAWIEHGRALLDLDRAPEAEQVLRRGLQRHAGSAALRGLLARAVERRREP